MQRKTRVAALAAHGVGIEKPSAKIAATVSSSRANPGRIWQILIAV
jgi:hypothetical protein